MPVKKTSLNHQMSIVFTLQTSSSHPGLMLCISTSFWVLHVPKSWSKPKKINWKKTILRNPPQGVDQLLHVDQLWGVFFWSFSDVFQWFQPWNHWKSFEITKKVEKGLRTRTPNDKICRDNGTKDGKMEVRIHVVKAMDMVAKEAPNPEVEWRILLKKWIYIITTNLNILMCWIKQK